MLDTGRFVDHSTGRRWRGNSSFDGSLASISAEPAGRWRRGAMTDAVRLIEFACGADMRWGGYEPEGGDLDPWAANDLLDCLARENAERCSWRTDLGDPRRDREHETRRRTLLSSPTPGQDPALVRRSFLFEDVFATLKSGVEEPTECPPALAPVKTIIRNT